MKTSPRQSAALFASLTMLVFSSGCVDAVEPAGTAQYENPDYPGEIMGYAPVSSNFTGAFEYENRIYVINNESNLIQSFSLDDPYLNMSPTPVDIDTLNLGFRPGSFCIDRQSGSVFIECTNDNSIYSVSLSTGFVEQFHTGESLITDLHYMDGCLLVCYLGPEWLVRKIDTVTMEVEGEFPTGWPIIRTALSPDGGNLLAYNSSFQFLLRINTETMTLIDTLQVPEKAGPFTYNGSGDIVVFNQNTLHPTIHLLSGDSGEVEYSSETQCSYRSCGLISGTDIVLAPRRSESRISVLNSDNMVFAPSLYCYQYADLAFSSCDGEYIIVLSDSPGRVYVYSHQ